MKQSLAIGKGRIIEQVITSIEGLTGFININGRQHFIESVNIENNTLNIDDGTEMVNKSTLRLTRYDVEIIKTDSQFDGQIVPLKSTQWKYAFKSLNRISDIEIVELDNGVVVAKQPTPDQFKKPIKQNKGYNKNKGNQNKDYNNYNTKSQSRE